MHQGTCLQVFEIAGLEFVCVFGHDRTSLFQKGRVLAQDGLSFTGMRERYLEAFDAVRVDNLNGDKYKTGKVAPDGTPDPSIFSTPGDPVGIQVGTAITTLVRKADHAPAGEVGFRHLWGQAKCAELMATAEEAPGTLYEGVEPVLPLGLPFVQTAVSERLV